MTAARTDPEPARRLLGWLTLQCRTAAQLEQERAFLVRAGVPAEFLPTTAGNLGRTDLA